MSAEEAGNGLSTPIPTTIAVQDGAPPAGAAGLPPRGSTPRDADGRPLPSGPGITTPRGSGGRGGEGGGRRPPEAGPRSGGRGRHMVEVPAGAEQHEGLVVSRQDKFGFIKGTTHEGRYFFHVNDCDGGAGYGATVSFVVARDLTTGKDVAYNVRTLAPGPPPGGAAGSAAGSSAVASRSSTPDHQQQLQHGDDAADASAVEGKSAGAAVNGVDGAGEDAAAQAQHGARRHAQQAQHPRQDGHARAGFEHFGHYRDHRHSSPASQRDWRLPRAEAVQQSEQQAPAAGAGADPSMAGQGGEAAAPAIYRGSVAVVARAGRQHRMDDGLLLYIDEAGAQAQARYGNHRLAEGPQPRLEPGDVVEFGAAPHPGGSGRRVATDVRFVSKSLLPTPSLEVAVAASEAGDAVRGRQMGRVALLKKEFGFIRQMERPGDMFFHFSQLEGWGPEEVKVGDDVEYTVRRDREGKLSAVQIRRAPPGSVVFEVVSEELLRGVVLEKPVTGKQYVGTSGVLEYEAAPPAEGAETPPSPALPPGLAPGRLRLPFGAQDVAQGSGALRPGDHVTFRIATNLQAARAAAQASVPGAAQYAGRRAVEVALVRYAGTVVQVNKERQFGFVVYGEDQLVAQAVPAGGSISAGSAAAEVLPSGPAGDAAGEAKPSAAEVPPAEGAPEAGEAALPDGAAAQPSASVEVAPVQTDAAPAEEAAQGVAASDAGDGPSQAEQENGGSMAAAASAAEGEDPAAAQQAAPTVSSQPKRKLFFHFKEVANQLLLRPGDEVVFVLHTNSKSGELNAQRLRRTKEAPPQPEKPEKEPKPKPQLPAAPAINPNRPRYSGNLSLGAHRQPRIAKGPDGTRGFELPRPHAALPPLPGLEKKVEPEEPEEGQEAAVQESAAEVPGGQQAPGGPATAPIPVPGADKKGSAASTPQGGTPPSAGGSLGAAGGGLTRNLSVQAPEFVPRSVSSSSLDKGPASSAAS